MCGIAGIYRLGKRKIRKWQLQEMAIELQHRGMDATGFAIANADGNISVWKIAEPAWKAVALPGFHKWCDKALTDEARILLVHTRAYTKGSPMVNANNHPLFAEPMAGVIVHNGMVRNDDGLFKTNEKLPAFERSCATDSDAFRAFLDNWGGIDEGLIKEMRKVDGTAAVAAIHRSSPGKLLLLRDSNPLVLGATADMIAFASTKEALHKALKPWIKVHNVPMQVHAPDFSVIPMPNETGYIFGPKGLEAHDVFKCNGRGYGGYVKYQKNTGYFSKKKSAEFAAKSEKLPEKYDEKGNRIVGKIHNHGHEHIYPGSSEINPTVKGRVTTLVDEGDRRIIPSTNSPGLYEFVICPNDECSKHVELSRQDRMLANIALLACKSCGANLAGGIDASMVN